MGKNKVGRKWDGRWRTFSPALLSCRWILSINEPNLLDEAPYGLKNDREVRVNSCISAGRNQQITYTQGSRAKAAFLQLSLIFLLFISLILFQNMTREKSFIPGVSPVYQFGNRTNVESWVEFNSNSYQYLVQE